jgi:CRP-like cAMP-binding protein
MAPNNSAIFAVDTLEKAQALLDLQRHHKAEDRLSGLFELYPETRKCTQEYIGSLIGLERETVSRALKRMEAVNGGR